MVFCGGLVAMKMTLPTERKRRKKTRRWSRNEI